MSRISPAGRGLDYSCTSDTVLLSKRYPGRQRVIARQDASAYAYDQAIKARLVDPDTVCLEPYHIAAIGLPSALLEHDKGPVPVEMAARCRKCAGCLEHRRRLWTARALQEVNAHARTWFGTLTIRPEDRFRLRLRADLKARKSGWEPLSEMAPNDAFKKIVDEHNREITLFLKRLRKNTGHRFRYLLVAEKHKSGDPHFHLLLHEQQGEVRKSVLEQHWLLGFSSWRLVRDARSAFYVCKYLSKDAQTRVRASVRYGQSAQIQQTLTERAVKAIDAASKARPERDACPSNPLSKTRKSLF